jgi:hypothetical protein
MPFKRRRQVGNYINVRLATGKDDDLIGWWESLPSGTGGEVVKRAIREYLESAKGEQERPATAADVEQAARWVVEQMRGMAALTPGPSPKGEGGADGERLTDAEIRQRERTVRARKW